MAIHFHCNSLLLELQRPLLRIIRREVAFLRLLPTSALSKTDESRGPRSAPRPKFHFLPLHSHCHFPPGPAILTTMCFLFSSGRPLNAFLSSAFTASADAPLVVIVAKVLLLIRIRGWVDEVVVGAAVLPFTKE